MESGALNEQSGEGVKKSVTENANYQQDDLESLINDQCNAKFDHTDLKLARYESSLPDNMVKVNKSSNIHESDIYNLLCIVCTFFKHDVTLKKYRPRK